MDQFSVLFKVLSNYLDIKTYGIFIVMKWLVAALSAFFFLAYFAPLPPRYVMCKDCKAFCNSALVMYSLGYNETDILGSYDEEPYGDLAPDMLEMLRTNNSYDVCMHFNKCPDLDEEFLEWSYLHSDL